MNKGLRDTIMDICIGMMCAFMLCGSSYAWIPLTIYGAMIFIVPVDDSTKRAKSNRPDEKETG